MQKKMKMICNWIIVLLVTIMLFPVHTFAYGRIDQNKKASLTLEWTPDKTPAEGVELQLYRVAKLTTTGEFEKVGKFEKYSLALQADDQKDWRAHATTLQGYIAADEIAATKSAKMDKNGKASFENLTAGLYLVTGGVFHANGKYYTPQPFLISLPNPDSEEQWKYAVEADVKYEAKSDGKTALEILKVWDDDGYEKRPKSIEVEVYCNKKLYKEVTLSKSNNWRCKLSNLDGSAVWSVKEVDVPDEYRVTVEKQGKRIVITNTLPDTPDSPNTPKNPSKSEEKLPQTGVLWWPVPVLFACGLLFILLGIIRHRGNDYE